MTTNNFTGASDYGLPSAQELESIANQFLAADIDGSLFEPEVCAEGIEKLATQGDTGVFDTAANKATRVFGGSLDVTDYENILGELQRELNYDGLSAVNAEFPRLYRYRRCVPRAGGSDSSLRLCKRG